MLRVKMTMTGQTIPVNSIKYVQEGFLFSVQPTNQAATEYR
jgi:hypothetical protein